MDGRATAVTDEAFAQLGAQHTERWTSLSREGVGRQPDGFERPGRLPRLGERWESLEDALMLLAEHTSEPDGVSEERLTPFSLTLPTRPPTWSNETRGRRLIVPNRS